MRKTDWRAGLIILGKLLGQILSLTKEQIWVVSFINLIIRLVLTTQQFIFFDTHGMSPNTHTPWSICCKRQKIRLNFFQSKLFAYLTPPLIPQLLEIVHLNTLTSQK